MNNLKELILQSLETELGGVQIYEAAIANATNGELLEELTKYRAQTEHHVQVMRAVCEKLSIDPDEKSPGRGVVHMKGRGLIDAINSARKNGDPEAAQLVVIECVVDAETKDHQNWELLAECASRLKGDERNALQAACDEVEEQEDEHLYHSQGWARELWMKALGLPAVLPPPEEKRQVKTAIGAARAKQDRQQIAHDKKHDAHSAHR